MKAIFTISIRGIRTHLGRLALTLLAITLGVGFVSGSLILTDSLTKVFDSIIERSSADIEGRVQAVDDLGFGEEEVLLTNDLLAQLGALPEVERARGSVEGEPNSFFSFDENGDPQTPSGPPILTFSWDGDTSGEGFQLVEGVAPSGANQIAIDDLQAEKLNVRAGDIVTFSTPSGSQDLEVSGIVSFEGSAGAWFSLFDLETAQQQFDSVGVLDVIDLSSTATTSSADMLAAVDTLLPNGVEAIGQDQVIENDSADFNSAISIFSSVLLGFAGVALFVSLFIIKNTFAILVGQRTREIGMLRAIGASSGHVVFSIIIEAIIIGIIGAVAGLFAGVGVSKAIQALISSGGGFPDISTVISSRTVIVSLLVGVLATVFAALLPALRAGRVSPIAAMNGTSDAESNSSVRTITGGVLTAIGLAAMALGLFGDDLSTSALISSLAAGALFVFIGVAMLSVAWAGPAVRLIGSPVSRFTSGRMATQNAARSPQRTSATATALMIGLALVTTVMVVGQSLKTSFSDTLDTTITADIFVYSNTESGLSDDLVQAVRDAESAEITAVIGGSEVRIDGDVQDVGVIETATGESVVDFEVSSGDISNTAGAGIAVFKDRAEDDNLVVGDTMTVEFVDGSTETATIEAIFDNQSLFGPVDWIIDYDVIRLHDGDFNPDVLGIVAPEGAATDEVAAELDELASKFGDVTAQDQAAFQEQVSSNIDGLLVVVNGLLGLALVVAFFGIVNTIVLSVLERTREIGLLRAVGMTRRQLRSVILWEGVIVSLFGAVLGIGLGVLFAWGAITAIPASLISTVTIPWTMVITMVFVAGVLGVLAAILPAIRASKMDVLEAIATN